MRVSTWGNSLAIRIPANLAEALALREGDNIELTAVSDKHLAIAKTINNSELLAKLRAYPKKLPASFKFDRDEANGR